MFARNLLITTLASAATTAGLCSQSLSGTFVDTNGAPVNNVAVIMSNGAPTGTSLPNGTFTIAGLRDRTYTVQIDPHNDHLAPQQFDINVSGATSLGTVVLQPGIPVSGRAVNASGTGLLSVNMNAYLLNGTKLFTPHDGSDALGNFSITVPVNTPVNIRAVPPVGTTLVPYDCEVNSAVAVNLGTVTLPQGYTVTGSVVDAVSSLPISGCEIVTTNMLTGEVVTQLNKLTSPLGAFSALLPFGLYQIDILPPLLNLHQGKQIFGLAVTTFGHNLGIQRLPRTVILQGVVTGPNGPVAGADIDIYTMDGYKLFTPNDNTNAGGQFAVLVPPGTYRIRVDPNPGTGLAGMFSNPVVCNVNTNAGILSVPAGVAANLIVTGPNGQPVANPTVSVTNPATGQKIVTPGNQGGANGIIQATVPLGTWNVEVRGPEGSLVKPFAAQNFTVSGPLTLPIPLQAKSTFTNLETLGILPCANGGQIYISWTFGNNGLVSESSVLDAFVELPDGSTVPFVPPIPVTFPPQVGLTLVLWTPTPILPANQLNRVQKFFVRFRHPTTGQVLDQAYVDYFPTN